MCCLNLGAKGVVARWTNWNMHFIVSYRRIPNITCGLGLDWLAIWKGSVPEYQTLRIAGLDAYRQVTQKWES